MTRQKMQFQRQMKRVKTLGDLWVHFKGKHESKSTFKAHGNTIPMQIIGIHHVCSGIYSLSNGI